MPTDLRRCANLNRGAESHKHDHARPASLNRFRTFSIMWQDGIMKLLISYRLVLLRSLVLLVVVGHLISPLTAGMM